MENLGCITYREPDLLVDRARASHAEIQRVATVIAHEVAHMWFGDLVTMQWWEGIWLNEAFATFMEVLCTDAAHPEWRMWVDFGVERDIALQIDGLHSTRPIEFEVISPVDSLAMIDTLTYEKGGSVLRMLEQYLGQEVFRDSIRRYLRQHSYANAVSGDLWNALEVTSGLPIGDLMNSWILQGGHPLVTYENGLIRQEPFAYGPARGPSAIGSSWIIPVRTRSLDGGPSSGQLLGDVALAVDETAPVVLNAGGSGVFRSQYGAKELSELVRRLGELEELERTTLVADSWALLFADRIPWTAFLSVVEGLGDHDEPSTWSTVTTAVGFVNRALRDVQRDDFVDVVRGLFAPQFLRLGWEAKQGEGALAPQMRALAIATLGTLGRDEAIRGEAVKRFEANEIEGDLANAILRVVADQNRTGDYDTFLERYRQSPNPQEERRYLHALASFSEEELALDAARRCFGEFRNQDAPVLLGSLSRNIVTGPAVWRVVAQRWPEAMEKFPAYLYPRLALGVSTFITDDKFAEEVEAFYAEHSLGAQQRKVNQEIEKMRVGLAFTASIRQQF
jgi:puromycin-sensitive aminopeptidase